jgi:hypothetical protein
MNLNFKVKLLIRNLFTISFKMEDGNVIIKFSNCLLCMGFQWKCLGFSITFSCDISDFVFVGAYYHQFHTKIEIIFDLVV